MSVHTQFGDQAREAIHRSAVDAALQKAAHLQRINPVGDPYGAAGQALEDYVRHAEQLRAGGADVSGWIHTVTQRRWINELRHHGRRNCERLDAPVDGASHTTVGELTAARQPAVEDLAAVRERLRGITAEHHAALTRLERDGLQDRHLRIIELALATDLMHHEIALCVNREFPGAKPIQGNTVTQVVRRQRERLDELGLFTSVVARLRRTRRAS